MTAGHPPIGALVAAPLAREEIERGGAARLVGPAEALARIERLGDLFAAN